MYHPSKNRGGVDLTLTLRKRRQATADGIGRDGPAFAEVLMDRADHASVFQGLRLTLPCGTAIEVATRAALPLAIELLQALRRPC